MPLPRPERKSQGGDVLERIEEIQGIGLLHNVNGKKISLHKASLIYADNGRGKSTLASILRSASTGEGSSIAERRTIDGMLAPKVVFQFASGHKVTFASGAWAERRPEIFVFDVDFIEKNVHSGGAVNAGQRKNLLEFALGAAAVSARKLEAQTTSAASAATALVNQLTGQLAGYHQGLSLSEFKNLAAVTDADIQIEALQKRIVAANSITSILSKPVPSAAREPHIDLDALFAILAKSLGDIEVDAEKLVNSHVAHVSKAGTEAWLSAGQNFDNGTTCPYCDQDTAGIALVRAYRTHFNAAYAELKKQVAMLERGIEARLGADIVESFASSVATATAMASAWVAEVNAAPIAFDKAIAAARLTELREFLLQLAAQKQTNPTVSIADAADKAKAESMWREVVGGVSESNQQITAAKSVIEQFRNNLAKENTAQLQVQILKLQASKRRVEPIVIEVFSKLTGAKLEGIDADRKKKKAREDLETLMSTVIGKFEKSINALLTKFGAAFQIEKMNTNFRGGAPRSEYGLSLRGKSVPLDGGTPNFSTALSEGDKRTLGFAFFIATTLADPDLASSVIVIDDPMCSLDVNRRHYTKTVLKQLHDKAEQLILLAHDPYFIRDIRDELKSKDGQSKMSVLQLRYSDNDYSDLDFFDVDQECESPYYRHHRMLSEFCATGAHEIREVAKAIRPFLEGYLHRRFPGLLPKDQMFGGILTFIREVTASHPAVHAQPLTTELQEINSYAGQFHHDTNPGNADTVPVVATELKAYCHQALRIVHSGTVPSP
jgi:wobble nucleotide-excising tRNase